ncbi:MAG: DinB family protein [Spirochaetales bacterium]|nr:DinB family protein [Spirochaetales bacterium]
MLDGLIYCYERNLDYMTRLCGDVDPGIADRQVVAGMNHPLWVLSHLNIYHDVMLSILENREFPDPKDSAYGMGSLPQGASAYRDLRQLLADYTQGARRVLERLRSSTPAVLANPVSLPRWQNRMPIAGKALPYLMLVHENQHMGQISAWRRAMQLPPA